MISSDETFYWEGDTAMNDQIWYVYQKGQQLGPFATPQISQMIHTNMIAQDAYLFKVGWKDWRPIEETYEEIGLNKPQGKASDERRAAAPRATISGRIVVHNNGQLIIGQGVNISSTGLFVETRDQIFKVGEKLKLSVRIDGFAKAFNATVHVMRFNSDPRYPVGFGMRFENLDATLADEIEKFVAIQKSSSRKDVV